MSLPPFCFQNSERPHCVDFICSKELRCPVPQLVTDVDCHLAELGLDWISKLSKVTIDICDKLRKKASQLYGAYEDYTMSALTMLDTEWRERHDKIAVKVEGSD